MKTYLEILVPLNTDARWLHTLKSKLSRVPVRWQNGYFHITIAFIDDYPEGVDVTDILNQHIVGMKAPVLCFDFLDAFTVPKGNMHIIHLGVGQIPSSFVSWVADIRNHLVKEGCILSNEFKLHVTLGRVLSSDIDLNSLSKCVSTVTMPAFTLCLNKAIYREFREEAIKSWDFYE